MIFDLKSGRRRRVVQVVFGFLAAIFLLGFVGFGIGGDVSGGIFDALGFGSGNTGVGSPQYEDQIEDAETTLESDPENQQALLDLARYHYLSATESGVETDPTTGAATISEEARAELEESVAAWERYMETDPKRPDYTVAGNAAKAYLYLNDLDGAAAAQEIFAGGQESFVAYLQLAEYRYLDGKLEQGDAAGEQAVQAADPSERDQVRKTTEAYAVQARKLQKQLEKQQEKGDDGGLGGTENPFGGLGGAGGLGAAPTPTPAP